MTADRDAPDRDAPTPDPDAPDRAAFDRDVLVVGGGVAGCAAATFTARAGLDTLVVADGRPTVARCAHLENYLGFPAGVDPDRFVDLAREHVRESGGDLERAAATAVERREDGGFAVTVGDRTVAAARVVAASWPDGTYLDSLDVEAERGKGKTFVEADDAGRTPVDGLYVAGRLGRRYHQAIVAAGDGATAGISLVHDARPDFYHDWVAPEGYFTNRGYDVPPGVEEVSPAERERRAERGRERLRESFDLERGRD